MTYPEFRAWAWKTFGYRIRSDPARVDTVWRTLWGGAKSGRAGTGPGNYAVYSEVQQRRFAMWWRARDLVHPYYLSDWLTRSESESDGWLLNDGGGIRWVADPEAEALELVRRGFIAIKCGI